MPSRSYWAWLYWWPVRRADQALFAEALNQALTAELEISAAVRLAGAAMPGRRFRAAVLEMAANCRIGYSLTQSLARTGVAVGRELLAALTVGEERGDLPGALAAFARRREGVSRRLAAAVGRGPEVTRFAAALARLLREHRLTVRLVEDAGRLAAGDGSAFAKVVERVAEEMRNGDSFSKALARQPRTFDPLFCALVGGPNQRDRLRLVLARLGEVPDAEPATTPGPAA